MWVNKNQKIRNMNAIEQEISYYRQELKKSLEAIQYLKNRGLTSKTVNEFKIGYAPTNTKYTYMCRSRIMIPIQDTYGDYVAFVGRTIINEDPKYWNSWESPEYQKGRILFGFAKAFKYIQKTDRAILVEGQFDLLTLWQNGIKNVVAGSGTGFTRVHARLLSRYAGIVYIIFDNDSAGQKGLLRTQRYLEEIGVNTIAIKLPKNEDPDSFVRKFGIQKFIALFKQE